MIELIAVMTWLVQLNVVKKGKKGVSAATKIDSEGRPDGSDENSDPRFLIVIQSLTFQLFSPFSPPHLPTSSPHLPAHLILHIYRVLGKKRSEFLEHSRLKVKKMPHRLFLNRASLTCPHYSIGFRYPAKPR